MKRIRLTRKTAFLPFNGCDPDFIKNVCKARCCHSSVSPTGTLITIHESEVEGINEMGGVVVDGFLQPNEGEKRCPFKTEEELCGIHYTDKKPFGCIASPWKLTSKDTLIIRNRYKQFKCFKAGKMLPAYVAFKQGLTHLVGEAEYNKVEEAFNNGAEEVWLDIPLLPYYMLKDNEEAKKGR
jgi:hypothetical protein